MAKDDHQKPSTLFREEAVRAAYESFGNPFQTRQLSIAMAAFLFVALLIGTAIFLASASYARTVTVQGVLMPARGTIDIVSDRAGVIVNIPARNGDLLSTNDPILVVSATPTLEHGRTLAAAISAVSARQMSLMQRSLDGKLELLTLNISALRTQRSELERDIRALAIQIDR